MKKKEIKVGVTYKNKGAGNTKRTVMAISENEKPKFWFGKPENKPNEPGVLFSQPGRDKNSILVDSLYLSAFAAWAGSVCEEQKDDK